METTDWKTQVSEGNYYQINNNKKVLYWDGTKWLKPAKDVRGNWGYLQQMETQPTKIKSVKEVKPSDIGKL